MTDPFDLQDVTATEPAPPPRRPGDAHLNSLNESQRQAVEAIDGPVLVLAGAGTGKTRVLTTRLAHILMSGLARPAEMLAVTFTNKAAAEMRHRVASILNRPVEGWWVATFHSTGARILRAHAEALGLKPNFTILDADDQVRLLKQLMADTDLDEKATPARVVSHVIQRWKDRGLTPQKVGAAQADGETADAALELYAAYQKRLLEVNAVDFGDLLLHCLTLFAQRPDVLQRYQQQFRYILVDEYQDTNVAQYLWLRLLAQSHRNICCVGDDDQAIYSWRGAEVANILRFEEDFPGAVVVRLERNYRSTPHILAAASGLIAHNEGRLGKTLWTDTNEGDPVQVIGVWDGEDEARRVGEEIEVLHGKQHQLNEMAVLVRAGFQTREFEERLITLGIPYRVIGGPRFYERQEIRDAVAYLRVVAQPDDDLAFERIVNLPKRGLGPATVQTIHRSARIAGISMTQSARSLVETDEIKPKARKALAGLLDALDGWRRSVATTPHPELTQAILEGTGYLQMWKDSKTPEAPGRLDNLKELVAALAEYENLAAFLEHISLVMENEESTAQDKVNLMTLHGAKGLEFETVFLPGWEEDVFPHRRALDEGGNAALEEERRLAYVGLTRARKRAWVLFAANRRVYGQWQSAVPSRFVDELPDENVVRESAAGLYGGQDFNDGDAEAGFRDTPQPRRRARYRRAVEPGLDWHATDRSGSEREHQIGERVFHQKFGYGRIAAIDGDKLEIAFEKAGIKKVLASFVEPV